MCAGHIEYVAQDLGALRAGRTTRLRDATSVASEQGDELSRVLRVDSGGSSKRTCGEQARSIGCKRQAREDAPLSVPRLASPRGGSVLDLPARASHVEDTDAALEPAQSAAGAQLVGEVCGRRAHCRPLWRGAGMTYPQ